MSTVLLDTTVASLLHPKKTNDALRVQYETHMEGQILAVSFSNGCGAVVVGRRERLGNDASCRSRNLSPEVSRDSLRS